MKILTLLLLMVSCASPLFSVGDDYRKIYRDPSGQAYFEKGRSSYYTQYLAALKEPSLRVKLDKGVQSKFRFMLLPSSSSPLVVRGEKVNGVYRVRSVRLIRDGNYKPVKITHDKAFSFRGREAKRLDAIFSKDGFWNSLNDDEMKVAGGLDGSQWIFEIHDAKGYRMIDVWSPRAIAHSLAKENRKNYDYIKAHNIDESNIRDFLVYQRVGEELLNMTRLR
jgi:hypothetical protein